MWAGSKVVRTNWQNAIIWGILCAHKLADESWVVVLLLACMKCEIVEASRAMICLSQDGMAELTEVMR
jgi:hypothetical protein